MTTVTILGAESFPLLIPLFMEYAVQNFVITTPTYKSVKELMDDGYHHVIDQCLTIDYKRSEHYENVEAKLNFFYKLLPCLPWNLASLLMTKEEWEAESKHTEDDSGVVEKFVNRCFDCFTLYFKSRINRMKRRENNGWLGKVYLKMIYFVSPHKMKAVFVGCNFWKFVESSVRCSCGCFNQFMLKLVHIVLEKLPEESNNEYFQSSEVLMQILNSDLKTTEMCSIEIVAKEYFQTHDLKNILIAQCPQLKISIEKQDRIHEETAGETIKKVSEIISENDIKDISRHEIAWYDIIQYLEKILKPNFKKDGDHQKIFLKTFLQIKDEREDDFKHDPSLFEKLVRLVKNNFDFLLKIKHDCDCNHLKKYIDWDDINELYSNHITTCAKLLQYLYILNNTWHQWFDIHEFPQLVENGEFRNELLEEIIGECHKTFPYFESFKRYMTAISNGSVSLFEICPALVSKETRQFIFELYKPKILTTHLKTPKIVSRHQILEDIKGIFNDDIGKIWSINFSGENGDGFGPTKEFYSIASSDFQKHKLGIWLSETSLEEGDETEFVNAPNGLYPRPSNAKIDDNTLTMFSLLGKLMAKALHDGHLVDIPLNVNFWQRLFRPEDALFRQEIYNVSNVLPMAATTIRQLLSVKRKKARINSDESLTQEEKDDKVRNLKYGDVCTFDDVMIDFTLPGFPDIEMKEGGKDIMLSPFNVEEYLECLVSTVLENGIREQSEAFLDGFSKVMTGLKMNHFLPEDFEYLFCGEIFEEWNIEYLNSCCLFKKKYTKDSMFVQYLFEVLSSFNTNERRLFLQFVTSCPRLPRGGLKSLDPPLLISRKVTDQGTEDRYLPEALTCFNGIQVPEYKSVDVARERLMYAIKEGANYFQFV